MHAGMRGAGAARATELRRRRGQPPNESRRSRIPVRLGGQPLTGELQLALAVLEDCVRNVLTSSGRPSGEVRRDLAWIESRDRHSPFAFEQVCEVLHIDAGRLRRRVLAALSDRVGPTGRLC
jgi:hypothetical protein